MPDAPACRTDRPLPDSGRPPAALAAGRRDKPFPANAYLIAALTLAIGGIGGILFYSLGVPASFLTGSAVAVTIAVVLRVPTGLPDPVKACSTATLGIMMGSGITPDALDQLASVPLAVIGLTLVVFGATYASYLTLRRVGGWDPLSALCGSIPGNLIVVMTISQAEGARMERVVMSQSTRIVVLVALLPFLLGGSEASTMRVAAPVFTWFDVVLTLALAAGSATLAGLMRVPAATIIGPLVASAVVSALDLVTIAVPAFLAAAALTVLGASVAVRFRGIAASGLKRMLTASIAAFAAAFVVALALAAVFSEILGVPFGAVFLAYAPGGLDAMIALSFLLHYEVAFVAVLHLARMLGLSFLAPFIVHALAGRFTRAAPTRDET